MHMVKLRPRVQGVLIGLLATLGLSFGGVFAQGKDAGNATDDTANDAADHGANGTGGSLTVARTSLDATGNPLRLRHNGQRNGGDKGSNSDKTADHDSSNDVG